MNYHNTPTVARDHGARPWRRRFVASSPDLRGPAHGLRLGVTGVGVAEKVEA
jgi:hypothetical protein